MRSRHELVEQSTESFPGGSNRMFFFLGYLSLSPSLLHSYGEKEHAMLTLNLGCHCILLLGKIFHLSKEHGTCEG